MKVTVDDENAPAGGVRVAPDGVRWEMWGEVDAAVQRRVTDLLGDHLRRTGDETLTVEMSRVTFIDSGGLRLLYTAAETKPTPPVLVGAPDRVVDLLRISGVDGLFVLTD
ncbi:STAS domain-containing protein [Cellulomonas sp. PhB143]|uniref:STAS domain-containing protein n=1 Tax=Cellulomonas sp. PhB143 TaxID=2485186 RepID=UPI000F48E86C|nr:STAS domain-containing protein [Cellulomonas sp. PhB143]ROS75464.1 anti-sigma B factor antagonist [Cellulomonas sp. PhB143]